MLRKDFGRGKTIWDETRSDHVSPYPAPRVDPTGEYVAWTVNGNAVNYYGIAIKSVRAPAGQPPEEIHTGDVHLGSDVQFCDWTDDGKLLASVYCSQSDIRLVVLRLDGTVERQIPTDALPDWARPWPASWRKHWHQ
jgi:hypothetical protein